MIHTGDALAVLQTLPDESVDCVITSPPYYGLRDYGVAGQIGLESTPTEYVSKLAASFSEVRRVLKPTGNFWLNLGDSYANDGKWGGYTGGKHVAALHCSPVGRNKKYTGIPPKSLIGIPWRVAFALMDDGWILRAEIIWHKKSPMPESVKDRVTRAHEQVFHFVKQGKYWYDTESIKEPSTYPDDDRKERAKDGQKRTDAEMRTKRVRPAQLENGSAVYEFRNSRSVWTFGPDPFFDAHFAVMPRALVKRCMLAGCPVGGTVLDPFCGSGTTGVVAVELSREFQGIELNPEYVKMAESRISRTQPGLVLA